MIGKIVSHYKIIEKLGSGGMGMVYKAEDTKLKRTVALKFLPPQLSFDPEAKERFIREAQTASSLDHPSICTIHEINETDDGQLYIVMACYQGETLKDKIKHERLKLEETIDIAILIALGLGKAHEKGIIHRDIKPDNIFITSDNNIKILDFGLAKLARQTSLTKDGVTPGTVAYMSPEQILGEEVDQRSDIWALGVTLYEMIAGKLPFESEYDQAVMYSILNIQPESLKKIRQELPERLAEIVEKALLKNPEMRYQSVKELIRDLKLLGKTTLVEKQTGKLELRSALFHKKYLWGIILLIIMVLIIGRFYFFDFFQPDKINRSTNVVIPEKFKDLLGVRKIKYEEGVSAEYANMLESTLKASLIATGTCDIIDQRELENKLGTVSDNLLTNSDIINLHNNLNLDGLIVGNLFKSLTKGHVFSVEYYNAENGNLQGTYNIQIDETTEKTLELNLLDLAYQITGKKTTYLKISSEYVVLNNKVISYFKSTQYADSVNQFNLPDLSKLLENEHKEAERLKSEGKINLHDLLLQMDGDLTFETFFKCAYSAALNGIKDFRITTFNQTDPLSMFSFSLPPGTEERASHIETTKNKKRLGLKLAITVDGLSLAKNDSLLASENGKSPTVPVDQNKEYDWSKLNDKLYDLKMSIKKTGYIDENMIIITGDRKTKFKTILYACKTLSYKNMPDGTKIELFPLINFGMIISESRSLEAEYIKAYKVGNPEQDIKLAQQAINSPEPYYKLWYYIILKKAKKENQAREYISEISHRSFNDPWLEAIMDYFAGSLSEEELFKATNDTNKVRVTEKKCEAFYYIGMSYLFKGNKNKAKEFFQSCLKLNLESFYETKFSRIELDNFFKTTI